MTKRELLQAMGIQPTKGNMETAKAWLEKAYAYYQGKEDKERARRFIQQFMKR